MLFTAVTLDILILNLWRVLCVCVSSLRWRGFTIIIAMISSFVDLLQSVAVCTPLIVILAFTFLNKSERGDLKEASLGRKLVQKSVLVCRI